MRLTGADYAVLAAESGFGRKMSLKSELNAWDGKSTDYLARLFEANKGLVELPDQLIVLLQQSGYQVSASWLLKAWLKDGQSLQKTHSRKILAVVNELENWQARLHILQCLADLEIPANRKKAVERFLRQNLQDANKFVRAWAYNGFFVLANQYPEYQQEVRHFFDLAMQDEPASVKARNRNLSNQGFLKTQA